MSALGFPDRPPAALRNGALAVATPDGRLKLYDAQRLLADLTDLSRERQTSDRVTTALAWGQGPKGNLLLTGDSTGAVTCIDVGQQCLAWGPYPALDAALAAVSVSSADAPTVLAVASNGAAALMDLASGRIIDRFQALKQGAGHAALLSNERALVAGGSLVLLNLGAGGQRLCKWAGHAARVAALATTPDYVFCCTVGRNEQQVAVWSLAADGHGRPKQRTAVTSVALQQPAVHLSCSQVLSDGVFYLAAVLRNGGLVVLRVRTCPEHGTHNVVAEAGSASRVFHVEVTGISPQGVDLAVAAGTLSCPALHSIHINVPDPAAAPANITLPNNQGCLFSKLAGDTGAAAKGPAESAVLGVPAQAMASTQASAFAKRRAPGQEEHADGEAGLSEHVATHAEPTLGERVRAMDAAAPAFMPQVEHRPPSVKADSLSVLLGQALRTRDNVLLEKCLSVGQEHIISHTVQRLLPTDAALLVKAVVQRLQSAPARGEQLATWVRAVLLHHTGFLVGLQGMQGPLHYLYQLIEARLAAFQPLLALSGRLDMLLAHVHASSRGGNTLQVHVVPEQATVVAEVSATSIDIQAGVDGTNLAASTDDEEEDEIWADAPLEVEVDEQDSEAVSG